MVDRWVDRSADRQEALMGRLFEIQSGGLVEERLVVLLDYLKAGHLEVLMVDH